MAKTKTAFFCQNCGAQYSKWQGQCYACKEWNTIVEEVIQKEEKHQWKKEDEQDDSPRSRKTNKYVPLHEITTEKEMRLDSGDQELNNVLGGGIVHCCYRLPCVCPTKPYMYQARKAKNRSRCEESVSPMLAIIAIYLPKPRPKTSSNR